MVLAFSEWWRNSIRERSIAGQHKAREAGRVPGRPTVLTERQKVYIREELAQGGEPAGAGQGPGGEPVEDPAGGRRGAWSCSLIGRQENTPPVRGLS